jgi:hypothetical protein
MVERNADVPPDRQMLFRIGVNLGDVLIDGEDILGDGVNIAARLEGLAEPGGICVSDDAYRQVQGKVSAQFVDSGEQQLKNISRSVRVYRVMPQSGPGTFKASLPLPDKPSIAVLPFDNMSDVGDDVYFADGIAEDIITELSRYPDLFVVARNSSFTYRGKSMRVNDVARELGVRYLLEGSVRRAGTHSVWKKVGVIREASPTLFATLIFLPNWNYAAQRCPASFFCFPSTFWLNVHGVHCTCGPLRIAIGDSSIRWADMIAMNAMGFSPAPGYLFLKINRPRRGQKTWRSWGACPWPATPPTRGAA